MNLRTMHRTLVLLVSLAVGSGVALAETSKSWQANASAITRTAISGDFDNSAHPTSLSSKGYIYALEWSERGDDPCWFKIYTARLTGSKPSKDYGTEYTYEFKSEEVELAGGCPKKEGSLKSIQFMMPEQPAFKTTSKLPAVAALKVCTTEKRSSDDQKVKGIALTPVGVWFDGRFETMGGTKSEARTNCEKWRNLVSCPANQAATGITVHGSSWAHGISLTCAPMTTSG